MRVTCPRSSRTRRERKQSRWCTLTFKQWNVCFIFFCIMARPWISKDKAQRPAAKPDVDTCPPSVCFMLSTCRRLFTEWNLITRLCAWLGISLSPLSLLWMLTKQNLRKMRFVDVSHLALVLALLIQCGGFSDTWVTRRALDLFLPHAAIKSTWKYFL